MKKLLSYIAIVILGTAMLDGIYRIFCYQAYHNPSDNSYIYNINKYIYYDQPADLAILGASRANHHYAIKLIEDSLNIVAYNWGGDGQSILLQYLALLKANENGKLKIVILDLGNGQIGDWVKSHISSLYPYYWENDTIKNLVDEVEGMNMSPFMISSFVQYNSKINDIAKSHKRKMELDKGYSPIPYTGKPFIRDKGQEVVSKNEKNKELNSTGIKYLKRMASMCQQKGIRFIVCISPILSSYEKKQVTKTIKTCSDNGIECWDMKDVIKDPYLFKDDTHLNAKGAELFTEMLIRKLQKTNAIE